MIQRRAARGVELGRIARDLRGAADPDAIAEPGDRDLVALVHHGRFRRAGRVLDRHGDRIALDRIDRQRDAERPQQDRRIAAERQHVGIRRHHPGAGRDAGDPRRVRIQGVDADIEVEAHAELLGFQRQGLREHMAVAGLVMRQPQPAGELFLHAGQRGLGGDAALAAEHLERHAVLLQHRDVVAGVIELGLLAKQLQRAARTLVIADADLAAQRLQAVTAVFRDRDHPALVHRVARRRAVAQHLQEPEPHHGIELGADHQRAVLHQQPLHRLDGHAGAGPGR
ncbi:hypothetical protein ACVII1_003835 [Bradyrhizobium elkanii]